MADPSALHVPRIVGLVFLVAALYGLNMTAPRIVPAIIGLLVLYAALANVGRAESLIAIVDSSLRGLIQPSRVNPADRLPGHQSGPTAA